MTFRYGWQLFHHNELDRQIKQLYVEYLKTEHLSVEDRLEDPNFAAFTEIGRLMFKTIPEDPTLHEYSRGLPYSGPWSHWRRAKFGDRFHLYFKFNSEPKVIIYGCVVDTKPK